MMDGEERGNVLLQAAAVLIIIDAIVVLGDPVVGPWVTTVVALWQRQNSSSGEKDACWLAQMSGVRNSSSPRLV